MNQAWELLFYLIPAALLLWCLSPFSVWESDKAKRSLLHATYPKVSKGGNNPASQRAHEAGGLRFFAVAIQPLLLGIGWLGSRETGSEALIGTILWQVGGAIVAWFLTRQWIDIAEHSAEALHGDTSTLDPNAQAWLLEKGFRTYREGEVWRMVQKGQDYDHMSEAEFDAKLKSVEARARVHLILASW